MATIRSADACKLLYGLHCIWRPVSSQQTSMTRDPWKLDSVRSLLHLLDCPPVAIGHCPPGLGRLSVLVGFVYRAGSPCYSLGLILIASPSILQSEAGVGLDACLPLDVCCLVQGQAHRFCFVSTERSLGAGQVRRSNGTVTPL
jgi:hypothetical protein